MRRSIFALLTALAGILHAESGSNLFEAIRQNDCARVRRLLDQGIPADSKNSAGATAVMSAALYADRACLSALLGKKANLNAANTSGATALMWAVHDIEKVRLLLDHGADPNARSQEGRTALLIAARQPGSLPVIKLLLAKGADLRAKDNAGGGALHLAAETGDLEMLHFFLEKGADVNARALPHYGAPRFGRPPEGMDKGPKKVDGPTPLMIAAYSGSVESVRLLLERGADPKAKATRGFFADSLAASVQQRDPSIARMLLEHGADPNNRDFRGATALILAAAADEAGPEMIRLLLAKGADLNAKDNMGNTALAWAKKRGNTAVVRSLEEGPKQVSAEAVTKAVEKSLALLQPANNQFLRKSGCISCHHQSIHDMAVATARARGFAVNEEQARLSVRGTLSVAAPHKETLLQAVPTIPATTAVSTYALLGLAAAGHPADDMTDAMVTELAARQRVDGQWFSDGGRPPLDQSAITTTTLSLRALQLYPIPGRKQEFERRITRARDWLAAATPATTQEKTMRLMGLAWAKADPAKVQEAAAALAAGQRSEGGWAQLDSLSSDAYATGLAMVALNAAGMRSSDAVYQRGARFLIDTQLPDGSWHVVSRALGFQPYFESGYPHGHDQWISAGGAGWATMALALTAEPVTVAAR